MLHGRGRGLVGHDCSRFDRFGIDCPFRKMGLEPEEEDREEEFDESFVPRVAFVGERNKRNERGDRAERSLTIVHSQPEVREALERMAAFQGLGGLPSLPPIESLRPSSRGPGRGQIIALFAATMITAALLRGANFGSMSSLRGVRTSEMLAGAQLSALGERSGFERIEGNENVFSDFGIRRMAGVEDVNRRLRGSGFVGDEFSETGF